jgi:hypothetical protein
MTSRVPGTSSAPALYGDVKFSYLELGATTCSVYFPTERDPCIYLYLARLMKESKLFY